MLVANIIRAVFVAVFAFVVAREAMPVAILFVFILAVTFIEPFYDTASDAEVPRLSGLEWLNTAQARIQGTQMVAQNFIAVPLAAAAFTLWMPLPFIVGGALYALTLVVIPITRAKALQDFSDDTAGKPVSRQPYAHVGSTTVPAISERPVKSALRARRKHV